MTKDEDFKLVKIPTCYLQVNIHCDGCKQKVKKILLKIEGVYKVDIEAEQQKVTVLGSVDSATLIKKLDRAGKRAVLWSQKGNQNQNQKINCIKDDKNGKAQKQGSIKGLEALKAQQKFPVFNSEEDEDDDDIDIDEEDDEEEELRYLREKASQLGLIRRQALDAANNAKRGIVAASNNGKINNYVGNGNAQKQANPNQNVGAMKGSSNNPGGIDQKTMAALKMSNPHLVGLGNINSAEGKRGNDINSMMGRSGFLGNGGNIAPTATTALGGNSNGGGGFQIQQPNGFQGSSSAGLFPNGGFAATGHQQQHPSPMLMNLSGNQYNNHHPSQMMMNMNMNTMNMQQNRHAMQQPQMMYNRSPFIPTSTGYYYNYSPAAALPSPSHYYTQCDTHYNSDDSASHIFNNENTNVCSIL